MPPAIQSSASLHDAPDIFWQAVQARDAAADGRFVYAVRTTGIYCRPSCASRPAKRQNVSFFATPQEAETAGFRACKRCRPDQPDVRDARAEIVARACALIEASDAPPDLDALAEAAGLSRFHFHRLFRAATGVTPRAYAVARRAERLRNALRVSETVTQAIYESGFNSGSRFYESAATMLGMSPAAWRKGGRGVTIHFAITGCTLGLALVAASQKGVCAILLGDDAAELEAEMRGRFPQARFEPAGPELDASVRAAVDLIDDPSLARDLPLDIRGTAFQQRVWQALRAIPPGQTQSYAQVAERIGAPSSTRAVAGACAANHIAVAIPCHRVVRSDGALSGYRWGVERKRALLAREARAAGLPTRNVK